MMLAALLWIGTGAVAEGAGAEDLGVTATRYLSVPGQAVGLLVEGPPELLSGDATDATYDLAVRLQGPIPLDDVGARAGGLEGWPVISPPVRRASADQDALIPENTVIKLVLPPDVFGQPGAYVASVVYSSDGLVIAEGSVWLGRLVGEREPLDIACVWPLAQGVVRDAEGVFFDDRLAQGLGSSPQTTDSAMGSLAPGRLWDVVELAEGFPGWRHTLAIEPILLTQLGEMSVGYSQAELSDPDGTRQVIGPEEQSAASAAAFLEALKKATASGDIGVLAAPYAAPSAAVFAAAEWGDGTGQMRLGRQAVQQVLPLVAPVRGAFSEDLDLSSAALSAYSDASIDRVLVDASVADDLAEDPGEGVVAVRARDKNNERLTLILADSGVRRLVADPWDPGLVCAGIAARLTSSLDALVVTPAAVTPVPPLEFMRALLQAFSAVPWMRSATLDDLLDAHPPGSRPILLERSLDPPTSYLEVSLLEAITAARASIAALSEAADPTVSSVTEALLLAYTAESRWWSLPGTDPLVTGVGLDYAVRAQAMAEGELAKLRVEGVGGTRVAGDSGVITLRLENQADYALDAHLQLGGSGVQFPDGSVLTVSVEPGLMELPLNVEAGDSPHQLDIELSVGGRPVDTWSGSLSFVSVRDFLPWIAGGAALIVAMVILVFLRRSRGLRRRPRRG